MRHARAGGPAAPPRPVGASGPTAPQQAQHKQPVLDFTQSWKTLNKIRTAAEAAAGASGSAAAGGSTGASPNGGGGRGGRVGGGPGAAAAGAGARGAAARTGRGDKWRRELLGEPRRRGEGEGGGGGGGGWAMGGAGACVRGGGVGVGGSAQDPLEQQPLPSLRCGGRCATAMSLGEEPCEHHARRHCLTRNSQFLAPGSCTRRRRRPRRPLPPPQPPRAQHAPHRPCRPPPCPSLPPPPQRPRWPWTTTTLCSTLPAKRPQIPSRGLAWGWAWALPRRAHAWLTQRRGASCGWAARAAVRRRKVRRDHLGLRVTLLRYYVT